MTLFQDIQEQLFQLAKQNIVPDYLIIGTKQERQIYTEGSIMKADDIEDHFKQTVIILPGDHHFKLLKTLKK